MHVLDFRETRDASFSLVSGVSRRLDQPASQLAVGCPPDLPCATAHASTVQADLVSASY